MIRIPLLIVIGVIAALLLVVMCRAQGFYEPSYGYQLPEYYTNYVYVIPSRGNLVVEPTPFGRQYLVPPALLPRNFSKT